MAYIIFFFICNVIHQKLKEGNFLSISVCKQRGKSQNDAKLVVLLHLYILTYIYMLICFINKCMSWWNLINCAGKSTFQLKMRMHGMYFYSWSYIINNFRLTDLLRPQFSYIWDMIEANKAVRDNHFSLMVHHGKTNCSIRL